MRVFRFLNAKYGLEALKDKRLRISRLMELNDPFEFLGADLSDSEFRRALTATKRNLSQDKGILCFSRTWTNPVLWSHYSDRHRGICLGFDVTGEWLTPVKYVGERFPRPMTLDQAFLERLLFTKFEHWSYESEYRGYASLVPEEEDGGHYFIGFSRRLKLKQVIVGAEAPVTRGEVNAALQGIRSRVEVFKTRAAFTTFKVVRNHNEEFWA
jgi:hypothetical protein